MVLSLLALAPLLLSWLGLFGLCRELATRDRIEQDWRLAFLVATAAWATLLTFITELCSLGHALNRPALVIAWLLVDMALWTGWVLLAGNRTISLGAWLSTVAGYRRMAATWPLELRLMLLGVVLLVLFLGSVALLTPTTNWDSLTYHLPRVMHWVQNRSVKHFPTGCVSQLQMGPWVAFLQTHLFLLWGSDRFANLVQWFAMIGCICVATLIARQLVRTDSGQGRRIEAVTALLVATLPTGIVESITPQTDYVATFWFASLMSLALALWRDPSNIWYLCGAALAGGLGLLTKITSLLYMAPLGLATGLWLLWRWRKPAKIFRRTLIFVALVFSLILPHALRNREIFGSPTSSRTTQEGGQNKHISFGTTLSNVIRNAALHTNTGIAPLTHGLSVFLRTAHSLTGRSLSDPDSTFPPKGFKFQDKFVIYDSETGNAYHLGLILLAMIISVCHWKQNQHVLAYTSLLVTSYILFCMVLRWQQWNSRYHLTYFALLMPVVAIVLVSQVRRWFVTGIAFGVTLFAVVVIAANESRPVFNPAYLAQSRFRKMLFEQGPLFCEQLEMMARDVVTSGCSSVGVKLNSDDAEYPLWVALRDHEFTGQINHVLIDNESARIPTPTPTPCVIITMSTTAPPVTIQQQFPYRMEYGVMSVFWSEQASHWHELVYFDFADQTSRVLSKRDMELLFDRRVMHLYVRTPRPGVLRLIGAVADGAGLSITTNSLRVATDAGWEQGFPVNDRPISLEIPAPIGTTRIRLSLLDPLPQDSGQARLKGIRWAFDPR